MIMRKHDKVFEKIFSKGLSADLSTSKQNCKKYYGKHKTANYALKKKKTINNFSPFFCSNFILKLGIEKLVRYLLNF